MTESERTMVSLLVQAVDAMLSALADGCGVHDFADMRRQWLAESQPIRELCDAEYAASREGSGG